MHVATWGSAPLAPLLMEGCLLPRTLVSLMRRRLASWTSSLSDLRVV